MTEKTAPIPVILDTDIGTDIDDTWALAMLLRRPELDVRLVVSDTGNTEYRAAIAARLLETANRTDVPVGVGVMQTDKTGRQAQWVADYDLASYPGSVVRDGVGAIIAAVEASPVPVTLICIGPVTNIAEALRRAPHIAARTRFVGMHGSIRRHQDGGHGAVAEYNVVQDVGACRACFRAPWLSMTISPLDTCGQVRLTGARYAAVAESNDPLARAVLENYRVWLGGRPANSSTILYDTVAVHLAYSLEFLDMKLMRLDVTEQGFTVEKDDGAPMNVALEWRDKDGFEEDLARCVAGRGPGDGERRP